MPNEKVLSAIALGEAHGVSPDLLPIISANKIFEKEGITELIECFTDGCTNLTPDDPESPFATCSECMRIRR